MELQKPTTVAEYIDLAPEQARSTLKELYECLKEVAPDAQEGLKWSAPAFWDERILFAFAGFRDHVNFYPTPAALNAHASELVDFKASSSALCLPLDRPIPRALIRKIAAYRVRDVRENDARWM